jgi:hypothetical protein
MSSQVPNINVPTLSLSSSGSLAIQVPTTGVAYVADLLITNGTTTTFPTTSGTLALTSQIPASALNYAFASSTSTATAVVWTVQTQAGTVSISGSTVSFSATGFYVVTVSVSVTTTTINWNTTWGGLTGTGILIGPASMGSSVNPPGFTNYEMTFGINVTAAPATFNLQQALVTGSVLYSVTIRSFP